MFSDIVFPGGNENDFVGMALKLGYSSLCFVYEPKSFKRFSCDKLKVFCGVLYDKPFSGADFVIARANENIRPVLEQGKVDLVFDFELGDRKDFIHHRNSGLNQVLCKIMKENSIALGFNFNSILNKSNPQLLGRMMQNAGFARKYKLKTVLASFAKDPYEMRAPKDLIAFAEIVGINPVQSCLDAKFFK
jgi:hypothetical protein